MGAPAHALCGHTSDEFVAARDDCIKKERNNDFLLEIAGPIITPSVREGGKVLESRLSVFAVAVMAKTVRWYD